MHFVKTGLLTISINVLECYYKIFQPLLRHGTSLICKHISVENVLSEVTDVIVILIMYLCKRCHFRAATMSAQSCEL